MRENDRGDHPRNGRGGDAREGGHRGYRGGGYRSRSPPRGGYRGGPRLNTENQIYVARFNRRTTESDLRRAFEKYGYIEKIDLKDGRGFGFIVSTQLKRASTCRHHRSAKYSEQKNSCITYYQALLIDSDLALY